MTEIQLRRGTAATWTTVNPILGTGEPGFETDTANFKIGDGATAWTGLPYLASVGGSAPVATETARALAAEALLAPKASPALTGTPTAPTASALDSSTKVSTTAYADSAVGVEKTRALAAEAAITTGGGVNSAAIAAEVTRATTAEALKAPLASPALTGSPTAPTQTALDNSTKLATTAYGDAAVLVERTRALAAEGALAPLASPALTGNPIAPTQAALNNSTRVSTTAYTDTAVAVETSRGTTAEALKAPLASPALTGTPTAPTPTPLDNSTKLATTAYDDAANLVERTRALAAEALAAPLTAVLSGIPKITTVTGNAALSLNTLVPADATSAGFTLTLPTGVSFGAVIHVEKIDATVNVVSITGTIRGVGASTLTLKLPFESITFISEGSNSWRPFAGHKTLSSLDTRYVQPASPVLTGSPTAPTQTPLDNSTKLATTAYTDLAVGVENTRAVAAEALKAPLASPSLTGVPVAPTAAGGTNTTQIATTAFVAASSTGGAPLASPTFTGTPAAPTAAVGTSTTQLATTAFVQAEAPAFYVEDYIPGAANPAAAIEAAIQAAQLLGAGGGRVVFKAGKTYTLTAGTTPQILPTVTTAGGVSVALGPVDIDLNNCLIQLSTTVKRAFDFGPGAGGSTTVNDVYSGVTIRNGIIDANNVTGNHHVIIGTYVNSTVLTRINMDHITVRNMKTINVATSVGVTRSNVALFTAHLTSGEAVQTNITDILVEDCTFLGGLFGVQVAGGHNYGLAATTVNGAGQTIPTAPSTVTLNVTSSVGFTNGVGVVQIAGVNVAYTSTGAGVLNGCSVTGSPLTPATLARVSTCNANIFIDRVRINRLYHDTLVQPTVFQSAGAVDLISTARGGKDIHVSNVYAANHWDVNIEVDGCERCLIENMIAVNCFNNNFLHSCFNDGMDPSQMRNTWRDCHAYNTAESAEEQFIAENSIGIPLGDLYVQDCTAVWNWAGPSTVSGGLMLMGGSTKLQCRSITIDNFRAVSEGYTYTGAGGGVYYPILICPDVGGDGTTPLVRIRNMKITFSGTQTSTGQLQPHLLRFGGNAILDVDGVDLAYSMTNSGGGSLNSAVSLVELGAVAGTLQGSIKGIRVRSIVGDTTPTGVTVNGTALLTIPTTSSLIVGGDFSGGPAGMSGKEFAYTSNQNRLGIRYQNYIPQAGVRVPTALNLAAFVAGTWTTATGNQYVGGSSGSVMFVNGTGAGITAIDWSADNVTYYNMHTQASGVMTDSIQVDVDPGDYVKVTFATTQPTANIRFRK